MNVRGILPFRSGADLERAIAEGISHLRSGGVLGHPTETIYGLGSAMAGDGLATLARLKGDRDRLRKPFLLLIAGLHMLRELRIGLAGPALTLAQKHWPGPLTLILDGQDSQVPPDLRNSDGGVAVRWTSHRGLLTLITEYGLPMTSTSANRSGAAPLATAASVAEEWRDELANGTLKVLDAGPLPSALPSTILDCTQTPVRIVRPGAIPESVLRETLPGLTGNA